MGCDIHAHFEIKVGGRWLHYSQPRIERNYRLFTKMAGVREVKGIMPISLPRGIPENVNQTTSLEAKWWGVDGHSHSWLSAKEIAEVIFFHLSLRDEDSWEVEYHQWCYLYGRGWGEFTEDPNAYPKEIQDIRLIFWFDN